LDRCLLDGAYDKCLELLLQLTDLEQRQKRSASFGSSTLLPGDVP